jgi:hypothetical protein
MMKTTIVLFGLLLMSALFLQTNSLTRKTGAAGKPPMFQGSRCFDVDPGIGNPNRDDHYRWAQPIDSTRLMNNLSWKIGILFNCQYVSGDQLARGFGQMSGIIGDYVSNPACFNNDPNVTGRDRGAHEQWARTKTREQVRNNLQWKAVAAMKCLNRDYQLAFFADESAVLARIPSGRGGGGGGTGSAGCGLGTRWAVNDGGWPGIWTRRGNSNVFDGVWTKDGQFTALLTISINGNRVNVSRRYATLGGDCELKDGILDPDGVTVTGTTVCTHGSAGFRAEIKCGP